MAQAIVDPEQLRQFAMMLKRFNTTLNDFDQLKLKRWAVCNERGGSGTSKILGPSRRAIEQHFRGSPKPAIGHVPYFASQSRIDREIPTKWLMPKFATWNARAFLHQLHGFQERLTKQSDESRIELARATRWIEQEAPDYCINKTTCSTSLG